jgi:hypothetical protein
VDWLADVSYRLIIYDLAALILRNTANGVVTQLDQPPVGKLLVVCDVQLPGEQGGKGGDEQQGTGSALSLLSWCVTFLQSCVHVRSPTHWYMQWVLSDWTS